MSKNSTSTHALKDIIYYLLSLVTETSLHQISLIRTYPCYYIRKVKGRLITAPAIEH
jgi:hypothetical protein